MAIKSMSTEEFIAFLRQQQKRRGSAKIFAADLGVSPQYLSDVFNGRREPGPKVATALNMQRVTRYVSTTRNNEEDE